MSDVDKARGVLKGYLEDSELTEYSGSGWRESVFEYEELESRSPNGFFDYVLQTFVDFGSEEFGGEDTLETKKESFESYVKKQQLTSTSLSGRLIQVYGFELEDPYERGSSFGSSSTQLGTALGSLLDSLGDYESKEDSHNSMRYTEGLSEEQVNKAIENAY